MSCTTPITPLPAGRCSHKLPQTPSLEPASPSPTPPPSPESTTPPGSPLPRTILTGEHRTPIRERVQLLRSLAAGRSIERPGTPVFGRPSSCPPPATPCTPLPTPPLPSVPECPAAPRKEGKHARDPMRLLRPLRIAMDEGEGESEDDILLDRRASAGASRAARWGRKLLRLTSKSILTANERRKGLFTGAWVTPDYSSPLRFGVSSDELGEESERRSSSSSDDSGYSTTSEIAPAAGGRVDETSEDGGYWSAGEILAPAPRRLRFVDFEALEAAAARLEGTMTA